MEKFQATLSPHLFNLLVNLLSSSQRTTFFTPYHSNSYLRNFSFESELVGTGIWYGRVMKDLYHLALCSRRLNSFTTPNLYKTVRQAGDGTLLHRLITNYHSGIRDGCRRFIGSSLDLIGGWDPLSIPSFTEANFQECENIIHEVCILEDRVSDWIEELRAEDWDARTALGIILMTNLEEIEMEFYGNYWNANPDEKFIYHVSDRAVRLQGRGDLKHRGSLKKLRSVDLAYQTPRRAYISVPSYLFCERRA